MIDIKKQFSDYIPGMVGSNNAIYSSIVLPIIEIDGEEHLIFQRRSEKLKSQPGEISFPGGKIEEGEFPKDAAVREFCEEMCAKKDDILFLECFDIYFAPLRGIINCFIGLIDSSMNLDIKNSEVDEIFTVPLEFFIKNEPEVYNNKISISVDRDFPYDKMNIPREYYWNENSYPIYFYEYKDHVIWGITAGIVYNFVSKLKNY